MLNHLQLKDPWPVFCIILYQQKIGQSTLTTAQICSWILTDCSKRPLMVFCQKNNFLGQSQCFSHLLTTTIFSVFPPPTRGFFFQPPVVGTSQRHMSRWPMKSRKYSKRSLICSAVMARSGPGGTFRGNDARHEKEHPK